MLNWETVRIYSFLLKSYYPEKVKHYLCVSGWSGESWCILLRGGKIWEATHSLLSNFAHAFSSVYISFLRISQFYVSCQPFIHENNWHFCLWSGTTVLDPHSIVSVYPYPDPWSQKNEDISCFEELQARSKKVGLFRDLESSSWKYVASFEKIFLFFKIVNSIHFYFIFKKKPESW